MTQPASLHAFTLDNQLVRVRANPDGTLITGTTSSSVVSVQSPRAEWASLSEGKPASIIVPSGEVWQVQWVSVRAQTDGTDAQRQFYLKVIPNGAPDAPTWLVSQEIGANQSINLHWAPADSDLEVSYGQMKTYMPSFVASAGWRIEIGELNNAGPLDQLIQGYVSYIEGVG